MPEGSRLGFIVVYDDECGVFLPYGWDEDCAGALALAVPIVVFPTRAAARKAITISAQYARLCKAQGVAAMDDFLPPDRSRVKIVPVVAASEVPTDE